ncbi:MAG: hypothetical protein IJD28_06150 [Deferribacterales bacterium]|nr:hypothetical protein [Deferribacterales bacterium]
MKVVRTYKIRSQAEEAADFLMSKGIASSIHGADILGSFSSFDPSFGAVELKVQDQLFEKADTLLNQRENGPVISLPKLDFLNILKRKKKS